MASVWVITINDKIWDEQCMEQTITKIAGVYKTKEAAEKDAAKLTDWIKLIGDSLSTDPSTIEIKELVVHE